MPDQLAPRPCEHSLVLCPQVGFKATEEERSVPLCRVGVIGIEPTSILFPKQVPGPLGYTPMEGKERIELSFTASKAAVLPLDDFPRAPSKSLSGSTPGRPSTAVAARGLEPQIVGV